MADGKKEESEDVILETLFAAFDQARANPDAYSGMVLMLVRVDGDPQVFATGGLTREQQVRALRKALLELWGQGDSW